MAQCRACGGKVGEPNGICPLQKYHGGEKKKKDSRFGTHVYRPTDGRRPGGN